jgi:hypothetical protein
VDELSGGKVDLTFGSYASFVPESRRKLIYRALDIFGGSGVKFEELVALNAKHRDLTE